MDSGALGWVSDLIDSARHLEFLVVLTQERMQCKLAALAQVAHLWRSARDTQIEMIGREDRTNGRDMRRTGAIAGREIC